MVISSCGDVSHLALCRVVVHSEWNVQVKRDYMGGVSERDDERRNRAK